MGTCSGVAHGRAPESLAQPRSHCRHSCSCIHSLLQRCCSSLQLGMHKVQGCSSALGCSRCWAVHRCWGWCRSDCRIVLGRWWRGRWCSYHSRWSRCGCRARHCPAPGRTSHSHHTEWTGWRRACWGRSPCTYWWWAENHHNSCSSPRLGWRAGWDRTLQGR